MYRSILKTFLNNKKVPCIPSLFYDAFLFEKFKFLQNQLNVSIDNSKQTYYSKLSRKLANPATSSKMYGSILKTFLNNKKVPCIPPLFYENKFITNFKDKALNFLIFFLQTNALY